MLNRALVYLKPRFITIFLLGIFSGFPLSLTASTLSTWLDEEKISLATIGAFALVGLPYTLKFLWAPLVDQVKIPGLGRLLGRRRSWAVLIQLALAMCIFALSRLDPATSAAEMAIVCIMVTVCSATLDTVIDAYRIESLDATEQGYGAAMIVSGYRVGMMLSSAGALYLASFVSWHAVYALMAAFALSGLILTLLIAEPNVTVRPMAAFSFRQRFKERVIDPFWEFSERQDWLVILMLVVAFKIGDAFVGNMTNPFFLHLGFSKIEIANVVKIFGLGATLSGSFLGGYLILRFGTMKGLLICGVFQLLSNFAFVLQAVMGHDMPTFFFTIATENFTSGMGNAALVAYLSVICNRAYTATQYALLSAVGSVGRTFFSSGAGLLVQQVGWPIFFVLSAVIALPGILLLLWLMRKQSANPAGEFYPAATSRASQ